MSRVPTYDVAIVGAGPAGSSTAYALARSGHSVLMIQANAPPRRVVGEALAGAATAVMRDLGLAHVLASGHHLACPGSVAAWGSDDAIGVDSLLGPHGPGHHLDRGAFDADLRSAATQAGAVSWHDRISGIERKRDLYRLRLGSWSANCRRLVDATGRSSALGRLLGSVRRRDEPLISVHAWLRGGEDVDRRTWVEAAPEGWWYTALLPNTRRIVALHTTRQTAHQLLADSGAWNEHLARTRHIQSRLAGASPDGRVRATDAAGAVLRPSHGRGWIAIGDAALSFEPLSGQGLFAALYTALRGAQALSSSLEGDAHALEAYAWRLDQMRAAYIRDLADAYGRERRWPTPFWTTRPVQPT